MVLHGKTLRYSANACSYTLEQFYGFPALDKMAIYEDSLTNCSKSGTIAGYLLWVMGRSLWKYEFTGEHSRPKGRESSGPPDGVVFKVFTPSTPTPRRRRLQCCGATNPRGFICHLFIDRSTSGPAVGGIGACMRHGVRAIEASPRLLILLLQRQYGSSGDQPSMIQRRDFVGKV